MDEVEAALAKVTAALPAGEDRPGQLTMAKAVAEAIKSQRHLVVQAGTGTGKSLGYLVPALLSGSRVVIATATKALQDQLAGKDIPFLAEHMSVPFELAVLKGRSNYLCRQRAREVTGGDDQLDLDAFEEAGPVTADVARLLTWSRETTSGDRAELDFEPRPRAWAQLSVTGMECPGAARCPSGDDCFAEAARQRAEQADVIVVNTHLYGTHLASGGHVIPEHDVVIFDEAHELEDIASSALGVEITSGRFRALARTMRPLVSEASVLDDLEGAGTRLEGALAGLNGTRLPPGLGDDVSLAVTTARERVASALAAVRSSDTDDSARKARAQQAGGHLQGDLQFTLEANDTRVAWVEGPPHSPVLKVASVDVGGMLATQLWPEVTAVLTSATIPPLIEQRLGMPLEKVDVVDVGSPFDYRSQSLLYCAKHLPSPKSPAYAEAMHHELKALIEAAHGRTLALFTSWRAMTAAAEACADLPFPLLTQSDLPKPALIEAFTKDEKACLFATMGFWQGIDVPGRSLSLVVIDRLPFARPDDPLYSARRDRAGADAFSLIDVPRAATLLAQGAGRLIRSSSDRGVVAVLDSRLATARYRAQLLSRVPPMKRSIDRAEVERFLSDHLEGTTS